MMHPAAMNYSDGPNRKADGRLIAFDADVEPAKLQTYARPGALRRYFA
jgi:hypothetical protein